MIRQDGLTICDADKRFHDDEWHGIVVTDGKTILPGMIEIKDGKVLEHTSADRLNRLTDDNGNPQLNTKVLGDWQDTATTAHFCNSKCYAEWVEKELAKGEDK